MLAKGAICVGSLHTFYSSIYIWKLRLKPQQIQWIKQYQGYEKEMAEAAILLGLSKDKPRVSI